jgi:hypothetical protein
MLNGLMAYIAQAKAQLENDLPRNPQNAAWMQAKIAALQNPSLAGDIIDNRRWVESLALSSLGPTVPIACVFMDESMRTEAGHAVQVAADAIPLIETFMAAAFPAGSLRIWYGFVVGNSGGGGVIYTEDRTTYDARTGPSRLPYDAVVGHEAAHSYIAHESLTQFLELYAYNLRRSSTTDPRAWVYTRNWIPGASGNTGVAALIDIYDLIGLDTMQQAFRAVYPLRPPYGQPLSSAVIQAFLNPVPPAQRSAVGQKLGMVGF